jgi:hypothetical protein
MARSSELEFLRAVGYYLRLRRSQGLLDAGYIGRNPGFTAVSACREDERP